MRIKWSDEYLFGYKLRCCPYIDSDRLANITVTVSDQQWPITIDQLNSPQFTRCGRYHEVTPASATVTVSCLPSGILGRYVYIHSPNSDRKLTICETEIGSGEFKIRKGFPVWALRPNFGIRENSFFSKWYLTFYCMQLCSKHFGHDRMIVVLFNGIVSADDIHGIV